MRSKRLRKQRAHSTRRPEKKTASTPLSTSRASMTTWGSTSKTTSTRFRAKTVFR